jgi:hypothetical protein
MMSRFQRWARQLRQAIGPYKPIRRPQYVIDDELEIRRAVARDLLGETPVRPLFAKDRGQADRLRPGSLTQ